MCRLRLRLHVERVGRLGVTGADRVGLTLKLARRESVLLELSDEALILLDGSLELTLDLLAARLLLDGEALVATRVDRGK